jgi:hypothetical protein
LWYLVLRAILYDRLVIRRLELLTVDGTRASLTMLCRPILSWLLASIQAKVKVKQAVGNRSKRIMLTLVTL